MIELFPDHEQFYRYHAVLRIYADFCLKNSNFTSRPYNMPYNWLEYGKPEEDCYAPVIGRADDGTEVFGSVRGKFTSGDIGNIAANGQFAAIALKDPELQYFASRALRYYTGENQAAISMVAEVGAHYRKDIMSTMIGWIPGMMSNPDMRKNRIPTVPYHRHHASNEIYTQTQGWYATAAILLASPAALTLELKNIPADCMLTVHDLACDREVQKNPASERIELQLPGGALYRFSFGNSIEFTGYLLSGEKCVMPLDLNNFAFVGEIKVPGEVKAGEKFTVEVTLNGRGKARPVIAGQNLKFDSQFEERELPAVFRFEATAEKSGSPYVVMVHPEGKRRLLKSAAGVVTK